VLTPELEARITAALAEIVDPCSAASASPMNLVEMGLIREVRMDDAGHVDVDLKLTSPACYMVAFMTKEARERVGALPEVTSVDVHADEGLDWAPSDIHPAAAARRRRQLAARPLAQAS
jgi:metal-sulfur cluster biosynthetic enzyme